ncbi:MAG: phosphoribosylformylglycinamidine synthase subunit PurL [Candidatus Omnitrophica bacterium]|nr:phosphoribosylformylglycinamidine synthase subunit PurL [Candidatus Omnitrophota bacterium]
MIWRVEIKEKEGVFDALGERIKKDIIDLGLTSVSQVHIVYVYTIVGDISESQIKQIGRELLADSVTQEYTCFSPEAYIFPLSKKNIKIVEIAHNPGVMDPVEESTIKGIRDLGIPTVKAVRTAKQYHLKGPISDEDLEFVVQKALANKLIHHVVIPENVFPTEKEIVANGQACKVLTFDLLEADQKRLTQISEDGQLFLNLNEMKAIQKYFRKLKRNPTDCELEAIAQTWSEHCYHKTFRGNIRYSCTEKGQTKTKNIRNLLKSTIVKVTQTLDKPWCVSVFHDNAGVIKFDKDTNVCFKVETHNHPSALEPFGGANTGIGGVIRDILGTGLGAKPVCNTDVFCFAPPEYSFKDLPTGTLHPKRVMKGVVSGVRDYGNKMGIPTVNGAVLFDERFVGNPLVYCGTVGVIPAGKEKKKVRKGDVIVVAGGKTGRDGIHGATFSSGELTSESEVVSSGAVQIGDPIQEKKVLDVLLEARDQGMYSAITDCGAGGLSSAVGEMGEELGARVDLEKVPLKYQGLNYDEIWISESQERMVMSASKKNAEKLLALFEQENVEATVIGEFTGSKRLELFYHGEQVCDLEMSFMHDGIPNITKEARWAPPKSREPEISCPKDLTSNLLSVLSHYNVCSKEWIIRQYDHEVQGGSIIKPLVGVDNDGPSDASVVLPKLGTKKGIAISNGVNVRYGMIDPFWMAASCIDEAIRQIVAVGGNPDRIALLDNFCWGNPDKPDRLGGLVRCAQGCHDFALGYGTPFISGKDSLYNEYAEDGKSIAIPSTILISAIGIMDDVTKSVTMDFKKAGNLIYVVGQTYDELGGSIYYDTKDALGMQVPHVDVKQGRKTFQALFAATQKGLARSIHDCSEGGIAVALAEMAFSGGLGVTALLKDVPYEGKNKRNDSVLFSESNSRFVVEVAPEKQKQFEKLLSEVPYGVIGRVEESPEFVIYGLDDKVCVNAYIDDLKKAWQKPLQF